MRDANRTRNAQVRGYALGGMVKTVPREKEQAGGFSQRLARIRPAQSDIDRRGVISPSESATKDTMQPRQIDDTQSFAKGGKVKKVAGQPRGKEDGIIAVQKGEYVVRKAAARKYGPRKMAAVNAGTAKINVPKKR